MAQFLGNCEFRKIDLSERLAIPPFPNKFPTHHRLSKAVRRIKLGARKNPSAIYRTTFMVFVADDKFGICKLTIVHGRHARRNSRNGKMHLDFHTDYPKHQVIVFAMTDTGSYSTEKLNELFDETHAHLCQGLDNISFGWVPPSGTNRGNVRQTFNVFPQEPGMTPINTVEESKT
jgi:hypothetical protein